jgi:hypothetical protein
VLVIALSLPFALGMGARAADGFSKDDRVRAEALIPQLGGDSFAARVKAAKELEGLPAEAMPWLEARIDQCGADQVDLRTRLKAIARTLKKRGAEKMLRGGTQVAIDLKAAGPREVLDELTELAGISLTGANLGEVWDDEFAKDFTFNGSFWAAVDAMLEAFPPGEAVRENLGADYRMGRWGELDFRAAKHPSAIAGIVRVRHARMALENSGGKDYLVVTLVPNVEPSYQVESLALLVGGLTLEDGTILEPEKKVNEWKAQFSGSRYSPGGVFTWTFPLEKGLNLRGSATLEGALKLAVRRNFWCEADLPEDLDDPVMMNSSVELKVLERGDGRLKIQFEGKGSEPACFDDYELRKESYQLLDAAGEPLEFNVNSSSSGGGKGWRNSYAGKIEGDPAKVRANLPGAEQKMELKFRLKGLAMPGSSLVD